MQSFFCHISVLWGDGMVGLYVRLSKDDGREKESESIENQKAYLVSYCKEKGITDYQIFSDDGYSGLYFDRPAFLEMLKAPDLDTVITKDLSRLGRDYIKTGYYIENYFPLHGIRYIALNDNIDTFYGQDEMLGFRTVMNDMYARDISKKVRTALLTKKQEGKFIGSRAPYGYTKQEGCLVINDAEAKNVREIYRQFLFGESMSGIARLLTRWQVSSPMGDVWNDVTVRRILTNPTYAGHLTQNRSMRLSYKLKKRKILAETDWITVKNTHKALITEKAFGAVKNKLTSR